MSRVQNAIDQPYKGNNELRIREVLNAGEIADNRFPWLPRER